MAEHQQQVGLITLELPINNITTYGPLFPGPATVLVVRPGAGFTAARGIVIAPVPPNPPGGPGTLEIQQSNDGVNWDHTDAFPFVAGGPDVPFDITVIARYVRVRIAVAVPLFVRFHGLLVSA